MLGYGKAQPDYFFDDNNAEHKQVRNVNWLKKGVWGISDHYYALKTLTDITNYPDFIDCLRRIISLIGPPPGPDRQKNRSLGTQSEKGNRWVERILSHKETCRLKAKATFPFLAGCVTSNFQKSQHDLSWI